MFEHFRNKLSLSEAQRAAYSSCFTRMEVPARTILLAEGAVSKKAFLVEKGCIRAWFNNEGKHVTFQFFFEQSVVASIESFRKNIPSLITVETIEPCVLWCISKQDIDRIIREAGSIPVLRDAFIDAVFERTFDYMKHFLSFIRDTPTQRYLNLLQEKPLVAQRVPQHYIASYLGISTVHLSRIKSKLAKKK